MKKSAQRAIEVLQSLDFQLDHEDRKIRTDRWIFTHSNAPDQRLIVNFRMSDAAASKVLRHAEAIVGLARTETEHVETRAEREAKRKRSEAAERQREIAAAKKRADTKDAQIREARRRQFIARNNRNALTTDDRLLILDGIRGEWIDPLRITDELCVSERRVRAAINGGALDAYMCAGKRVQCKVREVREWVRGGCLAEDG
ncbi:MAG TPA: hypothetical protein VFJ19_11820, partial [Nocardioidaceae bacterium]|nr:hypothetical protein [Nocardioidaceae bacterium]